MHFLSPSRILYAMRSILLTIAFLLSAPHALAATDGVAGFLSSPIWHTPDTYYPGDTVRIYAALMNSSSADVSGTLRFLVNDHVIGSRTFTMRAQDQVVTVWYDWEATSGSHTFSAAIADTIFSAMGSSSVTAPRLISTSPHITATTSIKKVTYTEKDGGSDISGTSSPSLGETLDTTAEKARESLEHVRNTLDEKIAIQAARVAGTSTIAYDDEDASDATGTVTQQSSGFFQSIYLWLLKGTRGILSFGISILKNPLWTALALVALFMLLMKVTEIVFRKFMGSKRE